jgi:hypothetical protein
MAENGYSFQCVGVPPLALQYWQSLNQMAYERAGPSFDWSLIVKL